MISQVNSSVIGNAYVNNSVVNSGKKEGSSVSGNSQINGSKIEKLKESIDSGEYKVNLSALSKKMAEELL